MLGVMLTPALAVGAALVAFAFALMTFERWLVRRSPQDFAWSVALLLFVGGAGSLAWGMALDGFRPDRWDVIGALICLSGVGVIMYGPRSE